MRTSVSVNSSIQFHHEHRSNSVARHGHAATVVNPFDKMTETPRKRILNPLVLIVCVCDKYSGNQWLPGNDKDLENIRDICRVLNYKDIREVNLDDTWNRQNMGHPKLLENFLRPARQHINNSKSHDGLIFFYSGHGDKDSLIFPGDESYKWQFIFDFFNGKDSNCPVLADKPKLFILDNCRGRNESRSNSFWCQVSVYFCYFPFEFCNILAQTR